MKSLYCKKGMVGPGLVLLLLLSISVLLVKPVAAEDASQLFDFVSPSVVSVMTGNQVIGSGFIVNSEGYIVTCAHVAKKGTKLKVKLFDGRVVPVEVLDQDAKLDLAVLQTKEKSLPTANLSLMAVKTGNNVYAVGAPLGMESSLSQGVVANPSRTIEGNNFIQVNIAINSGNSGGPLFNASAQVVGVNSMKMNEAEGIGFAIPSSTVVKYLQSNNVPVATVTPTKESKPAGKPDTGEKPAPIQPEIGGKVVPLWIVIGVIIILVLAAGGGGYWYYRRRRARALSSGVEESEPEIVLSSRERQQSPPEDNLEDIDIDLK
ncbi:MAG TPA: trypsin-like serine protease [Gelria sp.]|nr:trypsin-like serine protease [Gelria sp.]